MYILEGMFSKISMLSLWEHKRFQEECNKQVS